MSNKRVWLITGCSSGLGRELALAALNHGDNVIATARDVTKIEDLRQLGIQALKLDVTSPLPDLKNTVEEAMKLFGKIDVLVNNAGYVHQGGVEESSPEETLSIYNTNVFGVFNVTRAILPHMRSRKAGTIVIIGSMYSWCSIPGGSLYCSSKFAIAGFSEALKAETAHLGIDVMLVEPGYFRTPILTSEKTIIAAARVPDYNEVIDPIREGLKQMNGKQPGDPKKGAQVIVDVVTQGGAAKGRGIPSRLALGPDAISAIEDKCKRTLEQLDQWKDMSINTNHNDVL